MFCDQCEQTFRNTGCNTIGVCGKDADVEALQKLLLYGLKGMAAYKHHARRLGQDDVAVNAFIEEALFATMTNVNFDAARLFEMCMECGRQNLRVMQLLNDGHIQKFGEPGPAEVYEGTKAGLGILVTGHDLMDLWDLLEQVRGTKINVYTHGEMLPAHMYSKLRSHPNLAGHFGGAWQKQREDFEEFTGPIVGTTNCVLIPRPDNSYLDRFFTTRATAVPGAPWIKENDFSQVIAAARDSKPLVDRHVKNSTVGFHHTVLMAAAPQILDAVKNGLISRFFVVGGCDGAEPGRNYYADFAAQAPADSLILTLGCGKYRIRDHEYGTVAGFPRLLDMGQCNDAYGAIQVAIGLAGALNCGVNDLPLTLVISWFEQKAIAVLLTLLSLGVKGIRIGPQAPAFLTPNIVKTLAEQFDLQLITAKSDAKADLAAIYA